MNTPNRPRGFEDRLLHEFKNYFEERNQTMTTEESTRVPRFSRGKKFSLAGAVGAVALGIGAIVALPALTASPAYAVEKKENGDIWVEVNDAEDAEGLEETLAEYGIKAKVDFPPDGKMCNPDRFTPGEEPEDSMQNPDDAKPGDAPEEGLEAEQLTGDDGPALGFTVDADHYPLDGDRTLVIEISAGFFGEDGEVAMFGISTAVGEVGECDPVEADYPEIDEEDMIEEAEKDELGGEDDKGTNEQKDDDGSKNKD